VQSGGGVDGFLARFDTAGQPRMSTYVGGSATDRLRALAMLPDGALKAGGESDSPAIPALTAPASVDAKNAGKLDGLLVQFHQDGIYATELTLGNGLAADLPVTILGANFKGIPITVLSTDPSRVTVNGGAFSTSSAFRLEGFAPDGIVDLVISVPGLPPRHVPVTLRPSYLVNPYTAAVPVALNSSAYPEFLFATTYLQTGEVIDQSLRSGLDPGVSFLSSDSSVLQSRSFYNPYQQKLSAEFKALNVGKVSVTIVSPLFAVRGPGQIDVTVGSSGSGILRLPEIAVGKLLETSLPLLLDPASPAVRDPFTVRLTSEDPSKLLLSASPGTLGSASITVQFANTFGNPQVIWVQGRDSSGIVRIRAEVDGVDPVYGNIALAPSALAIASPAEALNAYFSGVHHNPGVTDVSIPLWSTRTQFAVVAQIYGNPPAGYAVRDQLPSPENRNAISIMSSDITVVSVPPISFFNLSQGAAYSLFQALLLRAGTSTLSASAAGYKSLPPLQVKVLPRDLPLSVSSLTLGKGLQTAVRFDNVFDFPPNVKATIVSSDPSRLLVSAFQLDEGPTATLNAGTPFFISALADSGDVSVTVSAQGYTSRIILVHLAPTTFGLSAAALTTTVGDSARVNVVWRYPNAPGGYPETHLRPKTTFTFGIAVSDPAVLRNDSPSVTFYGTNGFSTLIALSAGTATVSLISTSNAVVDPLYASSLVTVTSRPISLSSSTIVIGKNLQRPLVPIGGYPPNQENLTLRSLDPSRVLLTRDPGLLGTDTLDFVSGTVYAQAFADSGDVTLLATSPGYADASITIRLVPTAFGIFEPFRSSPVVTGVIGQALKLRVAPVAIDPASGNPIVVNDATLRPGVGPFEVNLVSNNPAVGRLLSPIAFIGGLSDNTTQFNPDAIGTTEISVVPPNGYVDGGKALRRTIQIAAPSIPN
jgi:hypothetical protein